MIEQMSYLDVVRADLRAKKLDRWAGRLMGMEGKDGQL